MGFQSTQFFALLEKVNEGRAKDVVVEYYRGSIPVFVRIIHE
jgi:hypothetical protein